MKLAARKTAISLFVAFLMGISAKAGRVSPLVVETEKPSLTVVKSGEPFRQTYRVKFLDLKERGKEIIVLTDKMQPGNVVFSPFEALGLEVRKSAVGKENIWDFTYTLRIIGPEKKEYSIPQIKFYWVLKDIGAKLEEVKAQESETEEVKIKYVSAITREKNLGIRDKINLGNFKIRSYALKIGSALVSLLFLWLSCRKIFRRDRSNKQSVSAEKKSQSRRQAYRMARRKIQELELLLKKSGGAEADDKKALMEYVRLLADIQKIVLFAELPDELRSYTAAEIRNYALTLPHNKFNGGLSALAEKYAAYEEILVSGNIQPVDLRSEIHNLEEVIKKLKFWGWLPWKM